MSYTALYRKFRPATFDEVKGQDAIVTTLKNQIKANRIGHAYLFNGTRGTGKTSCAKIFAKAVNCENPKDGSPCGECAVCRAISAGASMNVIEIDAASNNGVDNVREIVEEVKYSPTEGKYKVYIVDEVHMLTTSAFNALLKTLEEPPSYVIFILATTEVHKLPVTILSRCQRYDFKRITPEKIEEQLAGVCKSEGVEAEDRALKYLSIAADGAMRDGLSLLDRCIGFYLGEKLTYDKVLDVIGSIDTGVFLELARSIRQKNTRAVMKVVDDTVNEGKDLSQFVNDYTWFLRNLLLLKADETLISNLDISSAFSKGVLEEAAGWDSEQIIRDIRILSTLSNEIRNSTQKRVNVEVGFIKLCNPATESDLSSLAGRIKTLEKIIEDGDLPIRGVRQALPEETESKPTVKKELPKAIKQEVIEVAENWDRIVEKMPAHLKRILREAKASVNQDGTLLLVFRDKMDVTMMTESHLNEISGVIAKTIEKEVKISVTSAMQEERTMDSFHAIDQIAKLVPIEYD